MPAPVIWLLSAYRTDSHSYWADWLVANFETYEWQKLELPGRHFRWRIRGNPLSWLDSLPEGEPDLIIASSMVDLSTLKGLHARLADTPCLYYFHENQFAYPVGEHQVRSIEPQMVQLYAALAADHCLFNSTFNLDSLLQGIDELLHLMPDHVPAGVVERIRDKSSVLPIPIQTYEATDKQPLILWNHRWEYDKNPDLFADAIVELCEHRQDFELALLGARPQQAPDALQRLRQACPQHIRYDGRVSDEEYRHILGVSRIVVSTTDHEFQGLSVMQAVSAGAFPIVPDSLCYPEQYPPRCQYETGNRDAFVGSLNQALDDPMLEIPCIDNWLEQNLRPHWMSTLSRFLR